ncbi:hypothetical protein LOAG_03841 [Loa loa]|uniref:AMP-binding domain-containing protein n=1 Tax=Loa loa TaxID=7209 RepID=A0A1I7VU38_LOALO|nr:hypothetical protein LOAG_03841 [Loa loa]EFO24645.1 hypothetical protein LOAG_03841 [Loa loa]
MKGRSNLWCNVDGPIREDFPGEDTVDKLFTHAAKLYDDKIVLGTREVLKVIIFAETRADWLITSLFHINIPVAIVYATLGEKAIIQAISETEATLLVTSAELLTKIVTIRKKISNLQLLVYFRSLQSSKKIVNMDIIKE